MWLRRVWVFLIIFITFAQAGEQLFANIGDFKLLNGQTIKDCKIGYRTYGRINKNKDNVVVIPTWFGGTSEHWGRLIKPDGLIDSTRYFVIVVDALGNGVSSSPSNSKTQPGKQFPPFTIADMVRSQYQLLTRTFGINHVHAVMGSSMGGMQTFEWVVRYPNFMDAAVAMVGTPRMSAFDGLFWRLLLNIIELGDRYGVPADSVRGVLDGLVTMKARTPDWYAEHWKSEELDKRFQQFFKGQPRVFTNQNFAAQLKAMLAHDISRDFEGKMDRAAARVKARMLIVVASTDHLVNPKPALEFAKKIKAQTLILDDPCGHLAIGCNLKKVAAAIERFLR